MNFEAPIPFEEALKIMRDKTAMPTPLSTVQLSSLSSETRKLSLYSARTMSARYLEEMRAVANDMLLGKINEATGRQRLQVMLDELGYTPEHHFGTEAEREIAPAEKGSLTDLSSDRRIKLMLTMNTRLAANYGYMQAGMEEDALDEYPAYEYLRIYPRKEPRDWLERWVEVGGTLYGENKDRMIALKTDEIWDELGDSGIFNDGTDADTPPYAWNSGYGLDALSRAECEELGVIEEGEPVGEARQISLLGGLFEGPGGGARATLGELKSKRKDILAALAELKEAA